MHNQVVVVIVIVITTTLNVILYPAGIHERVVAKVSSIVDYLEAL